MIVFNIVILVIQQDKRIDVMPFPAPAPYVPKPDEKLVTCEKCGWQSYYTPDRARRGIAGHMNWCNRKH